MAFITTALTFRSDLLRGAAILGILAAGPVCGQFAATAYRVLGQRDFQQNGINTVQGVELYAPAAIALDTRGGSVHLYVSDAGNSRVLGWRDIGSYQTGDPPAVVLGQRSPRGSQPMGIGLRGFLSPAGLSVNPVTGDLYVADAENNRVLRFASPMANVGRVEPDAVIGQPDFSSRGANTGGIGRNSLRSPQSVAFDAAGNLWVADTGNHRVLRFSAAVLDDGRTPEADLVLGQQDFAASPANRGGRVSASGFDSPNGLAFDRSGGLYVSDRGNLRVMRFTAPIGPDTPAAGVLGQPNLTTRVAAEQASPSAFGGPAGLSVDSADRVYVAIPSENRVLAFQPSSTEASIVLGQTDFESATANGGVSPLAAAGTLFGATDVKTDSEGNVYVADRGNHRVLMFPANGRVATRIWGQNEFTANGPNQIKPGSVNTPFKIAIDYSQHPYAVYLSDTSNHRILGWRDVVRMRSGDPADFAIGQPDLRTAVANVDSPGGRRPSRTSLSGPRGIAVDVGGNLWVADTDNHRVLRFPSPARQRGGRLGADFVIGQEDFTTAASAVVSASSMRTPSSVALSSDGSVFVADAGNHRVLEFPAWSTTAVRVYGQPNITAAVTPASPSPQTLNFPQGVYVDEGQNLYVADTGHNRVVIFSDTRNAPQSGAAAVFVIGGGSGPLRTPVDVAVDSTGEIHVSDSGNNRILTFPSLLFLPLTGATPARVLGQPNLSVTAANGNSPDGGTSPQGFNGPLGIFVDRQDTIYVGDSGNNRVLHFLKPLAAVNGAHFQPGTAVARGSLMSLFGVRMSPTAETSESAPWPTSLAGRVVLINDEVRAPLQVFTPSQVNFQLPSTVPVGNSRIAVAVADTGELIAGGAIAIAASAPGLFSVSQDGRGQALAVNQDGRMNSAENPAPRGTIVTLYGTGQGQVSPPVVDGMSAPSGSITNTVAIPTSDSRACVTNQPSLCVGIGSGFGDVQLSGLAPGFVGLWQINVRIPDATPPGSAVPVRVLINAAPSNTVTIAVR